MPCSGVLLRLNPNLMLHHYLLIAFRAFRRNKLYTLLNVFGLTLGVLCSLIIILYVFDELTYESNHLDRANIYRLNAAYHLPNNGGFEQYATSGPMVAEVLPGDFPEIKEVVRVRKIQDVVLEIPASAERAYETFLAVD